jgi:hypothetical protein
MQILCCVLINLLLWLANHLFCSANMLLCFNELIVLCLHLWATIHNTWKTLFIKSGIFGRGQWRNYYGLRPGEPGGPQPQWAKWGPPRLGNRAKTLASASDILQCRFLTIRILWNLSPKSRKWHFRESRFKNFPDEQALDPLENLCIYGARLVPLALLLGGLRKFWTGGPLI